MKPGRETNDGWDLDRLHRDEITVAMNWVIRTCQDIVRECSHNTFWVPSGTVTGTQPTTDHLIKSARTDVLNKLRRQVDGVERIITIAEHERTKRKR
ncbi:hypothetical protein ABVG11_18000 [Streptomyces sp. HD1123-B1]|uniref:hypothetical protein n=1 Tax=Streptomyces huangiella TaxID=3228804 RepID=UPI003D7EF202